MQKNEELIAIRGERIVVCYKVFVDLPLSGFRPSSTEHDDDCMVVQSTRIGDLSLLRNQCAASVHFKRYWTSMNIVSVWSGY